jgi:regulator of sigma E protease
MTIILFILILSVLILVHEFGHFIVAKKNGIRVEEFGLGLPPKIFAKKVGETEYSLNLLPFGGFVKLTGEDTIEDEVQAKNDDQDTSILADESIEIESEEEIVTVKDTSGNTVVVEEFQEIITEIKTEPEDLQETQGLKSLQNVIYDSKSFAVKKPWQRFSVLIAGVFMNSLLAIFLFYIFFLVNGFKTFQLPLFFDYKFKFGEVEELGTVVTEVHKDSGASNAGIELGEAILEVDGVPVKNIKEVKAQLIGKPDQEVTLKLIDFKNQASPTTRVVNVKTSLDEEGNPILGVYLSKSVSINYGKPIEKIFAGFLHAYNVIGYSFSSFAKILGLSVETRDIAPVSQSVSGPVGIFNIINAILKYGGSKVWLTIMDYIALMSLSLAAINVLPLPALDGGRLAFVLVEWVSGRKVNPKWESNIHRIGMFFLLCLIVLITIKDIVL